MPTPKPPYSRENPVRLVPDSSFYRLRGSTISTKMQTLLDPSLTNPLNKNTLAQSQMDRLYNEAVATAAIALNLAAGNNNGKNGIVLQIVAYNFKNTRHPTDIAVRAIGEDVDVVELNFRAAEKIRRLSRRLLIEGSKEGASSASRDSGLDRRAGSIAAFDEDGHVYIFSCDGLNEWADEALVYALAKRLGLQVDNSYKNKLNDLANQKLKNAVTL